MRTASEDNEEVYDNDCMCNLRATEWRHRCDFRRSISKSLALNVFNRLVMVALLDGGLQACRTVNFIKPGYVPLRFVWRGTRAINLRASHIGTPFDAFTHLRVKRKEKKKRSLEDEKGDKDEGELEVYTIHIVVCPRYIGVEISTTYLYISRTIDGPCRKISWASTPPGRLERAAKQTRNEWVPREDLPRQRQRARRARPGWIHSGGQGWPHPCDEQEQGYHRRKCRHR